MFLVCLGFLVILATIFYSLGNHLIPYQCWINDEFGILCPTCKGTRAMASLLSGDVSQAIEYNLLVVFLFPVILYYWVKIAFFILRERSLLNIPFNLKFVYLILISAVVFTLLRNI